MFTRPRPISKLLVRVLSGEEVIIAKRGLPKRAGMLYSASANELHLSLHIAQSRAERLSLLTADPQLTRYDATFA